MSLPTALLDLIYLLLAVAAWPWVVWRAVRYGKFPPAVRWWGDAPQVPAGRRTVWLHAVSVGEVQVLRPLVAALSSRRPELTIVISTTTRTGYALARKHFAQQAVFYCPLDFSWAVRRALRRVRPSLLVLVELELWPNLISLAKRSGSMVAVVNGRLSQSSFQGYRRLGFFIRGLLKQLDALAVQDSTYADRFVCLGTPRRRVFVTGSMKFDGAQTDRNNPRTDHLAQMAGLGGEDVVFLAGSTQHPEEQMAVEVLRALAPHHPELRLVIVPRHPERFEQVARQLDASGLAWQRRSRLQPGDAAWRILLVDTVGELDAWWGTAQVGFVGGSMGSRGGQNMVEPSAFGVAVCFGPHTQNFRDIVLLLQEADACQVVRTQEELQQFVARCLADPAWRRELGERARRVVTAQRGATERTVDLLCGLLGEPLAGPHFSLPTAQAPADVAGSARSYRPIGGPVPRP